MAPCKKHERKQSQSLSGQSSIEFLYATGAVLLVFTIATLLFYQSSSDALAMGMYAETHRNCHEVAAQVEAIASAGDGASAILRMPKGAPLNSYTFLFSSQNRSLEVIYSGTVAGCALPTSDVRDAEGEYFFNMTEDAPIRNVDGGVVIG